MDKRVEKQINEAVNELILQLCPDAGFTAKYGGTLIEATAGDAKSTIGGLFFYSRHASFEFSNGVALHDPQRYLEGNGRFRRHLKFTSPKDIQQKQLKSFLAQLL